MINDVAEIKSRFDLIKDHKPKATKKLNELAEILASAYKHDIELADDMWQYLVDLNVTDNSSNSKFYIAQIFNKLTNLLEPEDATRLLVHTPKRVYLMILFGYEGSTMWHCLDVLIEGFLKLCSVENAISVIGFYFEKFDQLGKKYNLSVVSSSIRIADDLFKADKSYHDVVQAFLESLLEIEDSRINSYVRIQIFLLKYDKSYDCEELISLAYDHKFAKEYIELMWENKEFMSEEEFSDRWSSYLDDLDEENTTIPYPNFDNELERIRSESLEGSQYDGSKMRFFVSILKTNDAILPYYFNSVNLLTECIVYEWVSEKDWDRLIRYISQLILNSNEEYFSSSRIKRLLDHYIGKYINEYYYDEVDEYGRSYDLITKRDISKFEEILSSISAITVGCTLHKEYHEYIKSFMESTSGNYDALNLIGFDEKKDERNPEEKLKDYVHDFLLSGATQQDNRDEEYRRICKELQQSYWKYERYEQINYDYSKACDEELSRFFFAYSPYDYDERYKLLSACIKKNDVDKAVELIDLMASTKNNEGYDDLNGWGRQNMLTLMYLIEEFNYHKNEDMWSDSSINDEMRKTVKQLVKRSWSILPKRSQEELTVELYKITPKDESIDEYVETLLNEVDVYCTFPKPRGKGSAKDINQMSSDIHKSFKRLSLNGRLDIVEKVMLKFAAVKDILGPVTFETWMSHMVRELKEGEVTSIYRNHPEIFEAWLEIDNLRKNSIFCVAEAIGSNCTKVEFDNFRNLIFAKKGFIEGIDAAFNYNSDNMRSLLLFDGKTAKIEMDYIDVSGFMPISNAFFNFLVTRNNLNLDSVRIISLKINDIYVKDKSMGFYCTFDDGPAIGFNVYDKKSEEELIIYPDFFEKNGINQIYKIEVAFAMMDENTKLLEETEPIVLEYDILNNCYKFLKKNI